MKKNEIETNTVTETTTARDTTAKTPAVKMIVIWNLYVVHNKLINKIKYWENCNFTTQWTWNILIMNNYVFKHFWDGSPLHGACPASILVPNQALRHDVWRARPSEKVSVQGLGASLYWLMAFRLTEASSSDWPPERKTTPGMAGGTVLERAVTVAFPTSAGVALTPEDWPGVTMLGLRRVPSRYTWWSLRALYTAASTVSVT